MVLLMHFYSVKSQDNLDTCHTELIRLFNEIIKYRDCAILCGRRSEHEQNKAFKDGNSTKKYPSSKHNRYPSRAVDVAPYYQKEPHIRWNDREAIFYFGGFVLGVANILNISIRWGGNWNGKDIEKQSFDDLVHFEIK
jgi:hypothetical protein